MRGRGGGYTNARWGFLSALFSYMYLSACGLQNSSPESPVGLVVSDFVITGQHTNVAVYKTENKKKSCFFFSFQSDSMIVHIFTGSEMIHEKWQTHQSNMAIANKWKKGLLISLEPNTEFIILLPAIAHSLFFLRCVLYFAVSFHWSNSTETISLKKR